MKQRTKNEHSRDMVLEVRGAKEHNLQSVNLLIPKYEMVVFTGVSGSGKSSLAFDTLYAEGQRRYIESLSAYARQFLGQMDKPAFETIRGLSPTISIEQRASGTNPRSTVGTVTEIADYLRVLFARIGHQHCHLCGKEVTRQTSTEVVDELDRLPAGTKYSILAPLVENRKGTHKEIFDEMLSRGLPRLRVDGEIIRLENEPPELDKKKRHTIEVVVDRLAARPDLRSRITDSVETAFEVGKGRLLFVPRDGGPEQFFSETLACADCNVGFPELEPQRFSFNSPLGMCQRCNGLGRIQEIDIDLIIPDKSLSINDGAVAPWGAKGDEEDKSWTKEIIVHLAEHFKIPLDKPWNKLSKKQQNVFLYGTEGKRFTVKRSGRKYSGEFEIDFEGLVNQIERRYKDTQSEGARRYYARYMAFHQCPECKGARLRPESLAVRIGDHNIRTLGLLPVDKVTSFFESFEAEGNRALIAEELIRELRSRLTFLRDVGLGYLTLDRSAPTLSGGEAQRIRLASQIGSELTGVLYVLDEPSIGLHPRDNERLLNSLFHLRDLGNTVIVVEHDRDTIEAADHVVDFGPGAGVHGGKIVAQGSPKEIMKNKNSLTGKYLAGEKVIETPKKRRKAEGKPLQVIGASENNLQNLDIDIPLGIFTCVTGVSGAGKSSLVEATIMPALMNHLHKSGRRVGKHKAIKNLNEIDKVINIDQSPIGRTPRSNPATYVKVYDLIRRVFSEQKESRIQGYGPGRFSFNVKGGRCEACKGDGLLKVEMHFLPDVYVPCDICHGRRFNEATLRVRYKGLNIHQVLHLTVRQALEHFGAFANIRGILETLDRVGLGYLQLGQPSPTLSGGEAQRIKLSRELAKRSTGKTLYILDEPTTGLHFDDCKKLVSVLQSLVDAGNTVLVVEHNLEVVKCADWLIDLGPGGGEDGGQLVCCGTPEEVVKCKKSATGKFIAPLLKTKTAKKKTRKKKS